MCPLPPSTLVLAGRILGYWDWLEPLPHQGDKWRLVQGALLFAMATPRPIILLPEACSCLRDPSFSCFTTGFPWGAPVLSCPISTCTFRSKVHLVLCSLLLFSFLKLHILSDACTDAHLCTHTHIDLYTGMLRCTLACIHTPKHTGQRYTGTQICMNTKIQVHKGAELHRPADIHRRTAHKYSEMYKMCTHSTHRFVHTYMYRFTHRCTRVNNRDSYTTRDIDTHAHVHHTNTCIVSLCPT